MSGTSGISAGSPGSSKGGSCVLPESLSRLPTAGFVVERNLKAADLRSPLVTSVQLASRVAVSRSEFWCSDDDCSTFKAGRAGPFGRPNYCYIEQRQYRVQYSTVQYSTVQYTREAETVGFGVPVSLFWNANFNSRVPNLRLPFLLFSPIGPPETPTLVPSLQQYSKIPTFAAASAQPHQSLPHTPHKPHTLCATHRLHLRLSTVVLLSRLP
jgi:hypothetical protein